MTRPFTVLHVRPSTLHFRVACGSDSEFSCPQIDETDFSDTIAAAEDAPAEGGEGEGEEAAEEKAEAPAKAEEAEPEVFYYPNSIAKEAVIEYVGMYWLVGLNKNNKWPAEALEGTPQVGCKTRMGATLNCSAQVER